MINSVLRKRAMRPERVTFIKDEVSIDLKERVMRIGGNSIRAVDVGDDLMFRNVPVFVKTPEGTSDVPYENEDISISQIINS